MFVFELPEIGEGVVEGEIVGWKVKAGVFSDTQPRSVADIYSPATLLKVRGFKKMQRAADVDKQDRPLARVPK